MDRLRRWSPVGGIVACLLVLGGLALPYAVADPTIVQTYYGSGTVNPLVAGLLALLAIVVFAAGRTDRTDPALAAGVTLTFGIFVLGVTLLWALTVRTDTVEVVLADHRWLVTGVSLLIPVTAAVYAWSLGLLSGG